MGYMIGKTVKFYFGNSPVKLVQTERIWDILKKKNNNIKTSVLFWQNTMFANSDVVITPRPIHLENGYGYVVLFTTSKLL